MKKTKPAAKQAFRKGKPQVSAKAAAVSARKPGAKSKIAKTSPAKFSFPIVGIGASAGGLEAFSRLLAERVLSLIPTDVGRPWTDLRQNIRVPELERLLNEGMDNLSPREIEVQDRDGRWCLLSVRPYRTHENKIDGVVMALMDIDAMKRSAAEAQEARQFAEAFVETVREPLLVLDAELRVQSANQAFYQMFQAQPGKTVGQFVYELGESQWNLPKLRELLEEILPKRTSMENFKVDAEFADVGRKTLLLDARRLVRRDNQTQLILLAMQEMIPS